MCFSRPAEWPGNLNEGCISLVCVQCKESFDSAWDLMVHAQSAHMMNVYQLTTREQVTASPVGTESENGSTVSRLCDDMKYAPILTQHFLFTSTTLVYDWHDFLVVCRYCGTDRF